MRIGIFQHKAYTVGGTGPFDIGELIDDAWRARDDGLASYWIGQQFDWDATTLLTVLGREVPDIELGTSVTHMWTAFPVHAAQSAATASVLTRGRYTLGLGIEHEWVMRDLWGLDFEHPVSKFAEYLHVVTELLHAGRVDFEGEYYRVHASMPRFGAMPAVQVLVGALGPRMLALAGAMASGTTTWLTGVRTVRDHVAPRLREAAARAGRPEPRIVVNLPIIVTAAKAAARAMVNAEMDIYHAMPSYQAMLEREGVGTAGDIALVGGATEVEESIGLLAEAGATDLGAILLGDRSEQERTRALLRDLAPVGPSDSTPAPPVARATMEGR